MAFKSLVSVEGSLVLGAALVGAVFANYQINVGNVSAVQMTEPNHPALETSRKKAGYTSLVLVAGLALIARDPNMVILGGGAIIAMELSYEHGIFAHPETGQLIPPSAAAYTPAENVVPMQYRARITTPTGAATPDSGGSVASGGEQGGGRAANQAIAQRLAAAYGWAAGAEWAALLTLWDKESGWNNRAVNPSSGATGIPQALPASKMPKAAQSPTFNAEAQISWGLKYIKGRYGSPSKALAFHRSHNWY